MAKETTPMKRAGEFGIWDPFPDQETTVAHVEELIDDELILHDYSPMILSRDDGEIEGVAMLVEEGEKGRPGMLQVISWSAVLKDQCERIPKDQLPVLAKITQQGKSNRHYYSMS